MISSCDLERSRKFRSLVLRAGLFSQLFRNLYSENCGMRENPRGWCDTMQCDASPIVRPRFEERWGTDRDDWGSQEFLETTANGETIMRKTTGRHRQINVVQGNWINACACDIGNIGNGHSAPYYFPFLRSVTKLGMLIPHLVVV